MGFTRWSEHGLLPCFVGEYVALAVQEVANYCGSLCDASSQIQNGCRRCRIRSSIRGRIVIGWLQKEDELKSRYPGEEERLLLCYLCGCWA